MTGIEPVRRITDPMELPTRIAVRILELAYLYGENEEDPVPEWDTRQKKGSNPLRSVVPLVSHRWRALLLSHDAKRVLWRRVAIHDCTIPRKFCPYRFAAFWEPRASHVLELDVDILFTDKRRLDEVAHALIGLIAAVTNLRSLRLTGHLPVGFMLRSLEDRLHSLHSLSSMYLAGGDPENWHPEEAVQALTALNNLRQLEIRFRNDTEEVDPSLLESICDLTRLHHLSLHWPLRSALPPCGEIPDRFSELTSLTTLQLKRVPLQRPSPVWINSFPFLQHLYWDPFLPADISGIVPFTLLSTHKLRTLHLEMRPPLRVPSSLTTLERLVLVGRGLPDHNSNIVDNNFNIDNNNNNGAVEGDWGWLDTLTNLVSLRLQGGQLKELPVAVQRLEGLTRLGLMCNDLQSDSLPVGAWVRKLHHLHLGGNCLDEFPTALRQATALRTLFLAHQRACGSANLGARAVTQRMRLTGADVAALVNSPFLQTVVMGPQQPLVLLGRRTRDFEWLQRVLKQRNSSSSGPIRLTSNELAYTLEPLEVFAIQHLEIHENSVD